MKNSIITTTKKLNYLKPIKTIKKEKFALEQTMKAKRENKCISLLFI
jgi:hypothetical protein